MARDKTDKTDKTPAAISVTPGETSRDEIEQALDRAARHFLAAIGEKKAIPGWQILWLIGPKKIQVGTAKIITLTEEKAAVLVKFAETDPHAFDAASYVAGHLLGLGHLTNKPDCPLSLRMFGARVLAGELTRPAQRGRPRSDETLLWMAQYSLCKHVAKLAPLPLTRNREQSGPASFTACDAVAEAFTRAGRSTTQAKLASLCYDVAHAEIRKVADTFGVIDSLDI